MNLRYLLYYFFILLFSCVEPTLVPDKDCTGTIGGDAVVDNCGYCTGGTTVAAFNEYLGCDNACQGTQIDCSGECGGDYIVGCDSNCTDINSANLFDYCGECGGDNSTCSGCTDPEACNYDADAIIYNNCTPFNYYCDFDSEGLLDLNTVDKNCSEIDANQYCGPGTDTCNFIDCSVTINLGYIGTVIDCNRKLPDCDTLLTDDGGIDELVCVNYREYMSDLEEENGGCDFTITNCVEFNFDGGDCDLVDCLGTHFSEEICIEEFDAGCTTGEATWIGDGYCDEGDNELELNFNCAEWEYDGGDCESTSGRIIYGHKFTN